MFAQLLRAAALIGLASTAVASPIQVPTELGPLTVTTLAADLENPWAMAFLPQQQGLLITERPGRLRWLNATGQLSAPLGGVPQVYARGQGGLLDVALAPGFERERWVYLAYAEAGADGNAGTAVGRGKLAADNSRLDDFEVIFRQVPKLSGGAHFGARLVFDGDGYLFITLGDNNQRPTAQDLDKLQGKVVRLHADGRVPADNPFVNQPGARGEIWSYGHRNPQGAALNPWSGQLWTHEHGPRGGDEINLPQAGKNYGWPLATHGVNYSFLAIPEAQGKEVAGTEPPHHVWAKSPAISGMAFYDSKRFAPWQGNLFIGALAGQALLRLELKGDQVVHEERLLQGKARIRDVRQGPDGYLYVLTDAAKGQLLRLGLQEN
jgi:aldose sugar dehydrogenase